MIPARPRNWLLAAAILLGAPLLAGCDVQSSQPAPAASTDAEWGHLETGPDDTEQARADEGAQAGTNPAV